MKRIHHSQICSFPFPQAVIGSRIGIGSSGTTSSRCTTRSAWAACRGPGPLDLVLNKCLLSFQVGNISHFISVIILTQNNQESLTHFRLVWVEGLGSLLELGMHTTLKRTIRSSRSMKFATFVFNILVLTKRISVWKISKKYLSLIKYSNTKEKHENKKDIKKWVEKLVFAKKEVYQTTKIVVLDTIFFFQNHRFFIQ